VQSKYFVLISAPHQVQLPWIPNLPEDNDQHFSNDPRQESFPRLFKNVE